MDEISGRAIRKHIERIDKTLSSMDKTLALQHQSLEEHKKRSEANERAIDVIKDELKPIVTHITIVKAAAKFLSWVGASGILVFIISRYI